MDAEQKKADDEEKKAKLIAKRKEEKAQYVKYVLDEAKDRKAKQAFIKAHLTKREDLLPILTTKKKKTSISKIVKNYRNKVKRRHKKHV